MMMVVMNHDGSGGGGDCKNDDDSVVVVVDNDGGDGGSGHNDVPPSYIIKESLTPIKVIPTIRFMTSKACDLNFFLILIMFNLMA